MLLQGNNYGFSVPVVFRSKAQCEGNGHSLAEYCNVVAGHHRGALRVSLSTPTDCRRLKAPTVGAPLAKEMAIACESRLA